MRNIWHFSRERERAAHAERPKDEFLKRCACTHAPLSRSPPLGLASARSPAGEFILPPHVARGHAQLYRRLFRDLAVNCRSMRSVARAERPGQRRDISRACFALASFVLFLLLRLSRRAKTTLFPSFLPSFLLSFLPSGDVGCESQRLQRELPLLRPHRQM